MFPIGRYLALPSDGIFPENPEELSVGYVFNDPECGDGSETHTVREWFHKFNIPLKDDYFFALQITLKRNASSATAERLFHF